MFNHLKVRRFLHAMATICHWSGLGGRPFGYYIPYRYRSVMPQKNEKFIYAWLKKAWLAKHSQFSSWLDEAMKYKAEFQKWQDSPAANQPRFNQDWFPGLDGVMAYTMVRKFEPKKVIEIGSGHSTRFMAQAIKDGGLSTHLHSIDPVPRRDIDAICTQVTRKTVDQVSAEMLTDLNENDILFIDGSHIFMPGADTDYLFLEILPQLKKGVIVHIHDILLPYEYPDTWAWRSYNEQHAVLAILSGGERFEVLMPNAFVRREFGSEVEKLGVSILPGAMETSLWLCVC